MIKWPADVKLIIPIIIGLLFFISAPAQADINSANLLDNVLKDYSDLFASSSWGDHILHEATYLFWILVLLSMIWTFGIMAVRQADIAELFAEFLRFIVFTGFFVWILKNGTHFSLTIYDSLRDLAGTAEGHPKPKLSPSSIVDIGFQIFDRVSDYSTVLPPVDALCGFIMALIILVVLALVGINIVIILISSWMLAYAGIFVLGFGGGRWTSGIAVSYYKTVLSVAIRFMVMILVIGVGNTFLQSYFSGMDKGVHLKDLAVILIVAITLLSLIIKVPKIVASIITGEMLSSVGITSTRSGARDVSTISGAPAAGATNTAMGTQSIMTAFNERAGGAGKSSIVSGFSGGVASFYDSGMSYNAAATGNTPFSQAAGFSSVKQEQTGQAYSGAGGPTTKTVHDRADSVRRERGDTNIIDGVKAGHGIEPTTASAASDVEDKPTLGAKSSNSLSFNNEITRFVNKDAVD